MPLNNKYFLIAVIILAASELQAQSKKFCEIYGTIYVEANPARADYVVYVEDSEAFADILVFEEENEFFADRKGLWFFTKNREFAKFTVYFTQDKSKANFTIFYIESANLAGCQ